MKKILACCLVLFVTTALNAQWLTPQEEPTERCDQPDKYFEWFYGQRAFGLGYIPKDARLKAFAQKEALWNKYHSHSKQEAQSIDLWTPIGPINIESGSFAHSGRVRDIVTSPTEPLTAFTATAMGGVWKTTDGGKKWVPLSDNAYSLAFGALAIDPKNSQIIYGGTGEQTSNIDAYYGIGVLKTTNGGTSWEPSGLNEVGAFSKIIVNPNRSNTIYAAGSRSGGGVYISDDAGKSWRKTAGGLPPADITDLVYVNDGSRDVLYAGLPSHGTYRSVDGGTSWTLVHEYSEMRAILLGVDPKNWKDVVDLSVMRDGSLEGVSRTSDGGDTWLPIDNGIGGPALFGNNNQGWYDVYVARDPNNSDRIFLGGISVWRSEDGGGTWNDVGMAYQPGGVHPDQHCAAFGSGANPLFYIGCDGGIALSDDDGGTFTNYQDQLAITQFYGMAIDQNADDITFGGTQDNGTLGGGKAADWNTLSGGDGGTVIVDEDKSDRIFYHRPGDGNFPRKVENGNDVEVSNGILSTDTVGWVTPLVMDQGKNILYTGRQYFYSSTNLGGTWKRSTKKLSTGAGNVISCIDPFGDSASVIAGTRDGKVWYSSNNGVAFTDRSAGLPGRSVTAVRFSPAEKNTIYAALSGFGSSHVYKSTDKGVTWVNISSTLPDIPITALVIDRQTPTNLFVATDIGVFFSPNDGGDWLPYGTGLPNVAVSDIEIHRGKRVLRAATHGRSMYEIPLPIKAAGITSPTVVTKWYIGSPASISWFGTTASTSTVEISIDGGSNWQIVNASAVGTSISLSSVSYAKTDHALVKVTSGSEILLSQPFRILQTPAGATIDVVSEQPLYMYDLAYDAGANVLWTTNFSPTDTKIYKIDAATGALLGNVNLGAGRENLTGIKLDPKDNVFYIHQTIEAQNRSVIYKVSKTGTILNTWDSPAQYGTGVFPKGDTLFVADRNNNVIFRTVKSDPTQKFDDINLERKASFGPRCITYNPVSGELLHSWTDFQGTSGNAQLYDSYLLHLNYNTGAEIGSTFVQEGGNAGTNCRGLEYDPNSNGKSVWMTVLNSGNSSKIIKVTLTAGPLITSVHSEKTYVNYFQENYPNPFFTSTSLRYEIPNAARIKIIVRDLLGRMILSSSEKFEDAGYHNYSVDLSKSPSGTYIAELFVDGLHAGSLKLLKQ